MAVPLIDVQAHRRTIGAEIDQRVAAVFEHGKYIMGPEVAEFESALEEWVGSPGVVALGCANGTDALVLAAQALGLQPGQGVVVPSFTFVATAEAVAALGGVPVFADVDPEDFNIHPASIRLAIDDAQSRGIEVVGIIAVDLFGQPAKYPEIPSIADDAGCWVIADAAQSFGSSLDGIRAGALADVTTTSFFPAKPLGCYGDGGAIFTAKPDVAEIVRSLRVHGKGSDKYDNVRIGQNSRLDTLQAAILLPKLGVLGNELERRHEVSIRYENALNSMVATPKLHEGATSAWAQYTIKSSDRDRLAQELREAGIGNAVYYPIPLHKQSAYAGFSSASVDLSVSEELSSTVLSLPMHPYIEAADQDVVVDAIRSSIAPRS